MYANVRIWGLPEDMDTVETAIVADAGLTADKMVRNGDRIEFEIEDSATAANVAAALIAVGNETT